LQAFTNLGSFEKNYFQERTNSHPLESHFGTPNTLFRTPGVRERQGGNRCSTLK